MNWGSVDNLKVSARWGWRPKACQILTIDVWLMPMAAAIDRVDQWVASLGFSSRVFTMTASIWSSVTVRCAPGRGSSKRPSRRRSTKRRRHLPTVAWFTRSSAATTVEAFPDAQASTIRARSASACALL